jgi:hypothetical protein
MIELFIESLIDLGLIRADYKKKRQVKKQNKELKEKGIKKKYILYPSAKVTLIVVGIILPIWIGILILRAKNIKINKTKYEMNEISETLKNYKSETGVFPENLNDLIGNRPLRKTWTKDAWGKDYNYYKYADGTGYKLTSSGKDKKFGTKDDLIKSN